MFHAFHVKKGKKKSDINTKIYAKQIRLKEKGVLEGGGGAWPRETLSFRHKLTKSKMVL